MPSSARTVQGLLYFCHVIEDQIQNLLTVAEARHGGGLAQALGKGPEGNHQRQGKKKLVQTNSTEHKSDLAVPS